MIYEPLFKLEKTGVQMRYYTDKGQYNPTHWHSAIELIYILNGNGTVTINGVGHPVVAGEFVLIDSNQMHEVRCVRASMIVVIHFSRNSMKNFIENLDEYHFQCTKDTLQKEQLEAYLHVCSMLKVLPPIYVTQPTGFKLKSHAVAMEVFYELLHHFAKWEEEPVMTERSADMERMGEIITYIDRHHRAPISLESISSEFYLSREYFSRFFKKNMGVTFSRYVNQLRLTHIYHDICNTQDGIMEIAEKHGFTNYKLFNRMFHEIYGCTPREIRGRQKQNG